MSCIGFIIEWNDLPSRLLTFIIIIEKSWRGLKGFVTAGKKVLAIYWKGIYENFIVFMFCEFQSAIWLDLCAMLEFWVDEGRWRLLIFGWLGV